LAISDANARGLAVSRDRTDDQRHAAPRSTADERSAAVDGELSGASNNVG